MDTTARGSRRTTADSGPHRHGPRRRLSMLVAAIATIAVVASCSTGGGGSKSDAKNGTTLKGNVSTEALHDYAVGRAGKATLAFAPAGLGLTLPDDSRTSTPRPTPGPSISSSARWPTPRCSMCRSGL